MTFCALWKQASAMLHAFYQLELRGVITRKQTLSLLVLYCEHTYVGTNFNG